MARVAGTVVAVRDGRAWIECRAEPAACGACRGCSGAGTRGSRRIETPADAAGAPLAPGDHVELQADERRLLQAAARLYLPLVAGLLLGPALARWAGLEAGLLPLMAAAAGLAAGGLVARRLTRGGAVVRVFRP
jgi:positive regulator of sigma E activity